MGCFFQKAGLCTQRWGSVEAFVVPLEATSAQDLLQLIHLYKYYRKCYYERFPWPIICTQCDKEPILLVPITLTSLSGEVDCRSLYLQLLESCSASRLTSLVPTGRLFYQTCSGPDCASTRLERPPSFLRVCSFLLLKQVDPKFQNLFELVGSKQPQKI